MKLAVEDGVHQALPVDRERQGLADALVLADRRLRLRAVRHVHRQSLIAERDHALDLEVLLRLELLHVGRLDALGHVEIARAQAGEPRGRIRNGAEHDLVEGEGLGVPVVRIAGKRDVVLLHPLHEFIGARADGIEPEFGAGLLRGLRRDHHAGAVAERGQQGRIRLLQVEAHRERIDDIDAVDRGELRLADQFRHRLVALDVEFDGRRVEFLPVMEGDAVAQLEGDHLAVLGDLPGGREARHDLQIGRDVDELVAQRLEDDAADEALAGRRVEEVRIVEKPDPQASAPKPRSRRE